MRFASEDVGGLNVDGTSLTRARSVGIFRTCRAPTRLRVDLWHLDPRRICLLEVCGGWIMKVLCRPTRFSRVRCRGRLDLSCFVRTFLANPLSYLFMYSVVSCSPASPENSPGPLSPGAAGATSPVSGGTSPYSPMGTSPYDGASSPYSPNSPASPSSPTR